VSGGGDIGDFDLIAMAMTLQWFADPIAGLERLRGLLAPGGTLLFATIGPQGFPEWRSALAEEGLPDGLVPMPDLPGLVREEWPMVDYGTALSFLERLRGIGATTPRPGYAPLSAGGLRRALRRLDREFGACVTWHIVYGRLEA
jgi:malonyl-CoA O-methyltransferase